MNSIKILKKERKQAENYMLEGDSTMYETEAAYQAYIDGLSFAIKEIEDTSYVASPSIWNISFVDGRQIEINAGDIKSCLIELMKAGEPLEEVVTIDCLPDEEEVNKPKRKKVVINSCGEITDLYKEKQKFFSTGDTDLTTFATYLSGEGKIETEVYTPSEYGTLIGAIIPDSITIDKFDEFVANNYGLWNYPLKEVSHILQNDLSVVLVCFKEGARLVEIK